MHLYKLEGNERKPSRMMTAQNETNEKRKLVSIHLEDNEKKDERKKHKKKINTHTKPLRERSLKC